jgi:hypothetical protein
MNLYQFHTIPESLHKHAVAQETVPELVWKKYKNDPEELKKYENVLAKSPQYACQYAIDILGKAFPKGEPAIMKDAWYAAWYAMDIKDKRWKAAEPTIFDDEEAAKDYIRYFGINR